MHSEGRSCNCDTEKKKYGPDGSIGVGGFWGSDLMVLVKLAVDLVNVRCLDALMLPVMSLTLVCLPISTNGHGSMK